MGRTLNCKWTYAILEKADVGRIINMKLRCLLGRCLFYMDDKMAKIKQKGIKMRIKRVLIAVVIMLMVFTSMGFAENAMRYENEAVMLKDLGLFKGTNNGFELERQPNRAEAGVMLIRMLGKESVALAEDNDHPFVDVPEWASPYVGYMYQNGLTNGISISEYGSQNFIDSKSYATMLMRVLGYDDGNGDFSWSLALDKAVAIDLINTETQTRLSSESFLRDDMVHFSYNLLKTELKDSEMKLVNNLVAQGVVDEATAVDSKLIEKEIIESGNYTSPDDVADYLHLYGKLPGNYLTKQEARDLGWISTEGNLWDVTDQMSIGGDHFGNYEGLLPDVAGRKWHECDVNYSGGYRGAERLVYSNDGLIYYTEDHYESFERVY